LGAEKIATGHYAQVREFLGEWQLLKAEDGTKDQSYFLHRLNQAQLSKTLFPVGHLYKRDVRRIAEEAGLPNHARKDSTGICFIGERPFREFLRATCRAAGRNPRARQRSRGRQHEGLMYYTLGQREGLGIGGVRARRRALVRRRQGHGERTSSTWCRARAIPALLSASLVAKTCPGFPASAAYALGLCGEDALPAAGCGLPGRARFADECEVMFAAPQWAVTPGAVAGALRIEGVPGGRHHRNIIRRGVHKFLAKARGIGFRIFFRVGCPQISGGISA
jgi:tRNA-specific 2-thiouridylase